MATYETLRYRSREALLGATITDELVVVCDRYHDDGPVVRLVYDIDTGSVTDPDTQIALASGKRGTIRFDGHITPRMFGAYGQGSSHQADDTAAIDAMWKYVLLAPDDYWYSATKGDVSGLDVVWEPGDYHYNGAGLVSPSGSRSKIIQMRGTYGRVRININSDVYFLTFGAPNATLVEGLYFWGGKGAIRYTGTSGNVFNWHTVRECKFDNYTECAIGNNSSDFPHITIRECIFRCSSAATNAIGIAVGGLLDSVDISNNEFQLNRYHIKIGDRLGGNFEVSFNAFLRFSTSGPVKDADIWIVPNTSSSVNAGQGGRILENKFGNENMDPAKPRILIANEDDATGTDRLTRMHSTTDAGGYVQDVELDKNAFYGATGMSVGYVQSYITRPTLNFGKGNLLSGSIAPYIVQFMDNVTTLEGHLPSNDWSIYAPKPTAGWGSTSMQMSNFPSVGVVRDDEGYFQGQPNSVHAFARDPFVQTLVLARQGKDLSSANASIAGGSLPDARGNLTAAEWELSSSGGSVFTGSMAASIPNGILVWLEVELARASSLSFDIVEVRLNRNDSSNRTEFHRFVRLQDDWQKFVFPAIVRQGDGSTALRLQVLPVSFLSGTRTRLKIGDVRVYLAKSPNDQPSLDRARVHTEDANLALTAKDPATVVVTSTLSTNRTISLPTSSALVGMIFRIAHAGSGSNIVVGGNTLAPGSGASFVCSASTGSTATWTKFSS